MPNNIKLVACCSCERVHIVKLCKYVALGAEFRPSAAAEFGRSVGRRSLAGWWPPQPVTPTVTATTSASNKNVAFTVMIIVTVLRQRHDAECLSLVVVRHCSRR